MERILLYNGYGTEDDAVLFGHFFRRYKVHEVFRDSSNWTNFKNVVRKYSIKAAANLTFEVEINGAVEQVETNEQGYFRIHFQPGINTAGWHQIEVKYQGKTLLADYLVLDDAPIVVSDIDDTLLYSVVHSFWRKMNLLMFKNGFQRKKVSQFDQIDKELNELLKGGKTPNVFYVSNSEWNLYPMLKNFMEVSSLPKGVFQLNKLKVGLLELVFNSQKASRHGHKLESLNYLLDRYKHHQFILIGDTGQYDPGIYAATVEKDPSRVLGVILRRSGSKKANKSNLSEINRIRDFNVSCSVIV